MAKFRSFVFGRDPYPDWFQELIKQNKVELIPNENLQPKQLKIHNKASILRVDIGETVVDTGETIIKLNKEILAQYAK